uniref:Uncharacterized protein n=1 Tax=Rhizophora mucronata TaxID=61149 RepID=A0A2P2IYI1_RHIMU
MKFHLSMKKEDLAQFKKSLIMYPKEKNPYSRKACWNFARNYIRRIIELSCREMILDFIPSLLYLFLPHQCLS